MTRGILPMLKARYLSNNPSLKPFIP